MGQQEEPRPALISPPGSALFLCRAHGPVAALPDSRYCTMRSASSGPESADQTAIDGPHRASAANSAAAAEEDDFGPLLHLTAARGSGHGPLKPGFVSGSGSSWLLQWISSLGEWL